ncbi:MAG: ATP-binding protein [Coprococcus sp.]
MRLLSLTYGSAIVHLYRSRRYIGRISQPLMDRIDLNIEVLPAN